MSDDALAFLEKWIEDNTVAITAHLRAEKAEDLAVQCRKDAAEAGFSEEEIEEAIEELSDGEELAALIEEALDKAEEEEESEEDA
jgi:ATPase subunit of ABC transporter with duplicated ATPase domains